MSNPIKYNVSDSIDFLLKHQPKKSWDVIASSMRILTGQSYDAKKEAMNYIKNQIEENSNEDSTNN